MNRVFTYGILQEKHLGSKNITLISTDVRPKQKYEMRSSGYPQITPNDEGHHVKGTLLEVDDYHLRYFDGIEGVYDFDSGKGRHYNRVVREMNDGSEAFVYEVPKDKVWNQPAQQPEGEEELLIWRR